MNPEERKAIEGTLEKFAENYRVNSETAREMEATDDAAYLFIRMCCERSERREMKRFYDTRK